MRVIVAALVAAAVVLPPGIARADQPVRRTLERTADAAPRVRVDDPVGDVHVVGDDGATVRVTARVRASDDAAARAVDVEAVRNGDETHVQVQIDHRSPGMWQLFDRRRIQVDLTVAVPRASVLAADLPVGAMDVRGVAGAIDVHVGTGDLRVHDVAAGASVTVGTGDVRIELAPSWNGPRLMARSKIGDVRITAASGLRARVDAHTRLGDVHNALAAASAGAAAPLIDARTNVGDVSIVTR